jgi:hypothetical protein
MQLEVVIRHSYQIDQRIYASRRCANRSRIRRVPGNDFRVRIGAERLRQALPVATHDTVRFALGTKRIGNTPSDGTRRSKQSNFFHSFSSFYDVG